MSIASSPSTPPATVQPSSPAPPAHPYLDLFVISFGILFFELACIRWFGSTVVFLTFFTNIVLMACFLGMTVGCLAASRERDLIRTVIPLALVSVALAWGVLWAYNRFEQFTIDVENRPSPQQIFFGTEKRASDPAHFVVPIEAVAGVFFTLIALMFVGLGQVMGRAFNAIANRVGAYTTNVLGSLAGIAAFGVASYLRTPPLLWFAVSIGACLFCLKRWTMLQILSSVLLLMLLGVMAYLDEEGERTVWSPYSKVQYDPKRHMLDVNNIGHQGMLRIEDAGPAYSLPYLLNRDAGGRPFQDVLIIGAGSGNDVQAALANGVRHVDAVEIDPVLYEMGLLHHPDRPYRDRRVSAHLDDGRGFVHKTDRKYDLIVYGVVDSLVLHSGYSSLRLESFLFTEEALRDIKARLKPDGVFAMYNFYRQGWVIGRLKTIVERVFGTEPLVISLPYQDKITSTSVQGMHITFLMVGNSKSSPVDAIGKKLAETQFYWGYEQTRYNHMVNAYSPVPPALLGTTFDKWQKIGPANVDTAGIRSLPTDDWPFLYLHERTIPTLNIRGMIVVSLLSLAILCAFTPLRTHRPNGQMFFLGAGFMLLETKGVVHMALLFGSTWVVNSIVFAAILVMILMSNLFVLAAKPRALWPYYGLLLVSLLVSAAVPMSSFLALPGSARVVASCAVTFVPIFFAGIVFAASFRDSRRPDLDLGSNIGGVVLGGLTEFFSLVVGFNALLLIAIGFYMLSALFKPRLTAVPAMAAA